MISQEEFNTKMRIIQNNPSNVAVAQAVRYTLRYPEQAKVWYDSIPKATMN